MRRREEEKDEERYDSQKKKNIQNDSIPEVRGRRKKMKRLKK